MHKAQMEIVDRIMQTAHMFAMDAVVLPIPHHFEPAEIAAACLALSHHLFMISVQKFSKADNSKNVNGTELIRMYFGESLDSAKQNEGLGLSFDEGREQPEWFTHLAKNPYGLHATLEVSNEPKPSLNTERVSLIMSLLLRITTKPLD